MKLEIAISKLLKAMIEFLVQYQ